MSRRLKRAGVRLSALTSGLAAVGVLATPPAIAREAPRVFDIEAQPLSGALIAFAAQADLEFVMPADGMAHATSRSVRGALDPDAALARLLAGSGFEGRIEGRRLSLSRVERQRRPEPGEAPAEPQPDPDLIVVGTNIRGHYPSAYPVTIYDAEEISRTGAVTTDQFISTLTQNFASRTQFAPGATWSVNQEGVNGIDLRGLGVGTSLVLLNGQHMPLASEGRTVDVSMLPLVMIDRVEALTDGASAIYGADAIGGVVNFVLREGFDGVEVRVDVGSVTDGGLRDGGVSFVEGRRWRHAAAMFGGEIRSASALRRNDRPYTAAAGDGDLSPEDQRQSLVAHWTIEPAALLELSGTAMVSHRSVRSAFDEINFSRGLATRTDTLSASIALRADYELAPDIFATLSINHGEARTDARRQYTSPPTLFSFDSDYRSSDFSGQLSGVAWRSPAGSTRFSLGAGEASEQFASEIGTSDLKRRMSYAFGEVALPIFGADRTYRFLDRLELSFAGRYTTYNDESSPPIGIEFGERWSSKAGIAWSPNDWVTFRGSLSQSFRAPTFSWTELNPSLRFTQFVPIPIDGVQHLVLGVFGPGEIDAETAFTRTLGFDLALEQSNLRLRTTYYSIDYEGRVAVPDPTSGNAAFADPAAWPDIVYTPATAQEIEALLRYGPNLYNITGVDIADPIAAALNLAERSDFIVFDNRIRNLGTTGVNGLDIDLSASEETPFGRLWFAGRASMLFRYDERLSNQAPLRDVLDTVLRPASLRARLSAGIEQETSDIMLAFNYVGGGRNQYGMTQTHIDGWLTWDGQVSWRPSQARDREEASLTLSLFVQNMFDTPPPYVESDIVAGVGLRSRVGFDPSKADPVGRFVGVRVERRW